MIKKSFGYLWCFLKTILINNKIILLLNITKKYILDLNLF